MPQRDDSVRLSYPSTEARPEAVAFGEVRYQDSFRWLEDDSDEVLGWQTAQDELTQAYLDKLPAFRPFLDRMQALGAADGVTIIPTFAGGRWFIRRVPEGENLGVVEVADSPTGPGRRVIDLNAMQKAIGTHEPLTLNTFVPSPDGKKAIFGWTAGGREEPHVQIIEVDTGKVLIDGLPQAQPTWPTWLPDGSAIVYMAFDAAVSGSSLFRLSLEAPTAPAVEPIELDHPIIRPMASADGRHVILFVDHLAPRPHYILDTQGDGTWKPFLRHVPGIFRGDVVGDNFIAITDDGAPRGRMVAIPLATPTARETWKEIVPGSDDTLMTVVAVGGRIVLADLVDTYARLRVYAEDGVLEGEIALPTKGMVNSFSINYAIFNMFDVIARGAEGEILFSFSAFDRSFALYSADVATRQTKPLAEPKLTLDVQVLDLSARSADGERVDFHVVARRDLDLSKPHPTAIHGYGGFNVALLPGWAGSIWAAWVEAGGVFVLGHLRGGGEHGTPWFEQGRMKLKQNTFNDVFAIAEDLIARGLTTPDQLGIIGGSNGGTMAAAVAVQRPDLVRASVPQVPITDILGRVRDPITLVSSLDYGDPRDPVMAEVLLAWSPYQNVRDDVAYPAVLIDCGANDPRCPPWHGRKLAARMQQASSGDRPLLLRVRAGAGHGAVGKADQARQSAEVLAFLADELGLAV
jgi:prolyl oligopeptidase